MNNSWINYNWVNRNWKKLSLMTFLSLLAIQSSAKELTLTSPDKNIQVIVSDKDQQPQYTVHFKNKPLILPSKLGFKFVKAHPLDKGFIIASTSRSQIKQSWQQPWGESKTVVDYHHELVVTFRHHKNYNHHFTLRFRAFNDGIGFRYEVPQQQNNLLIADELTEFAIADHQNAIAWWIPARGWNRYEYLYRQTKFDKIDRVHTPLTFRTQDNTHVSIHEAALTDFAAATLDQQRPGKLKVDLVPWSDGVKVKAGKQFKSPWRTIQIADKATGLLNSHLILNLNEPNKLGDVSWVKPGKYLGIWWGMHLGINTWGAGKTHGATTSQTKHYMDFAAQYGFDGVLVEGWNIGWDGSWFINGDVFNFTKSYPDFDLAAVATHGRSKGVNLIGHHETSGSVTNYRNQMAAAYDLYQKHGVTQIKTGYVADGGQIKRVDEDGREVNEWHDGQFMVNEYLHSVSEAAKRKISINTHEPIKDTGLRRTYPNWISREGARGQEFNAWGSPPNSPEHTVNLVYTRMLSGPMDFTPGIFNLAYNGLDAENRVQTTLMKQLALYVVLYSPIQMAADLPKHYREKMDAFQFIVDVPTDWEKSIALAGEVGEFVVFARQQRDAKDWYLGAVTDEHARDLEIKLSFLEKGKSYQAQIYRDGANADWKTNPYDYVIEQKTVNKNDVLKLHLATSGGAAIRFKFIE